MAIKLTKVQTNELSSLSRAFNDAKMALFEYLDKIANDWEIEYDDKSDKWKDSDAGQAAQDRIDVVRKWADELPGEGEPSCDPREL